MLADERGGGALWTFLRDPARLHMQAVTLAREEQSEANPADEPMAKPTALEAHVRDQKAQLEMQLRAMRRIVRIAPLVDVERVCRQIMEGPSRRVMKAAAPS